MTDVADNRLQDVMQVCRNGHVITDLLHTYADRGLSHCDRCGAATLDRCATCGLEIPGAVHVPGLVPVGRSQPPCRSSRRGLRNGPVSPSRITHDALFWSTSSLTPAACAVMRTTCSPLNR